MSNTTPEHIKSNGSDTHKDTAMKAAGDVKSKVEDGIAHTQLALEDAATQTAQQAREASDKSVTFVRDNPVLAVAGAVGVGVLLGLALRSKA